MKILLLSCLISFNISLSCASIEQLQQAVENNDPVSVQNLIEHGVDVNTRLHTGSTVLIDAVRSGFKAELLHPDTPGCLCCIDQSADNNDTDVPSWYVHYKQLQAQRRAIITQLLNAGADVHACDERGQAALHCACVFGLDIEMVRLLLAAGANPYAVDAQGCTPLDLARTVDNRIIAARLADLFVQYGA